MKETPQTVPYLQGRKYPADNLSSYRFHTGASLRPLENDETCPILFRDLGPLAQLWFLEKSLSRLAGPYSPIIYMRTALYQEPYTDFVKIGRIVFLRPLLLHPWYSGVPTIYVARASRVCDPASFAYVPGRYDLNFIAKEAIDMKDRNELQELLGGHSYEEELQESRHKLTCLNRELEETEKYAEPIRQALQSEDVRRKENILDKMDSLGLTEDDLCTAWHHIPGKRRTWISNTVKLLRNSCL